MCRNMFRDPNVLLYKGRLGNEGREGERKRHEIIGTNFDQECDAC